MSRILPARDTQLANAPQCQRSQLPLPQSPPWCLWRASDARRAPLRRQAADRRRVAAQRQPPAASSAAAQSPAPAAALPPDFHLVSACGSWRVRPVNKASMYELRQVVAIQSQAFYEGSPLPMLDGLFRSFFMAEVLSEMQKKVKFNPTERFVLLVAEQATGSGDGTSSRGGNGTSSSSSSSSSSGGSEIIGVVEVSYLDEKEVLRSLGPKAAFAYIASMAVDSAWQRRGVATALLRAAEEVAGVWEEQQPVLHVYQDNLPAVQLYQASGYGVIFQDSSLWARVGARPRYLMQKQLPGEDKV